MDLLITRFENALNGGRARNNLYSEEAQWVPQYVLEDVLRKRAQSLPGVAIHFETEFVIVDADRQRRCFAIA